MFEIWLASCGLALLAVAAVAWRSRRLPAAARQENAAGGFRERHRELLAEADAQGSSAEDVAALEEELALEAIDADSGDSAGSGSERPALPALLGGAALAAAAMLGLYALWGEPHAPLLADANALLAAGDAADTAAVAQLQELLEGRVAGNPEDVDSWFFLAHLRLQQGEYEAANRAFAKLHEITGGGEQLDLGWAQSSFLAAGGFVDDATRAIVERVLGRRPEHPNMLELLSLDAIRRAEFGAASAFLERALRQPLAASRRVLLEETLALARARLSPDRPLIDVRVDIAGEVPPWLMVFARPTGGGMPLAVVRRPAGRTQTIILDDAASMNAALPLSRGGEVEVVVRATNTGMASASGAEAVSEPLDPSAQPRIALRLDSGP